MGMEIVKSENMVKGRTPPKKTRPSPDQVPCYDQEAMIAKEGKTAVQSGATSMSKAQAEKEGRIPKSESFLGIDETIADIEEAAVEIEVVPELGTPIDVDPKPVMAEADVTDAVLISLVSSIKAEKKSGADIKLLDQDGKEITGLLITRPNRLSSIMIPDDK